MPERAVTARVINSDGSVNDYWSETKNTLPMPDLFVVDDVTHVRRHLWLVDGQDAANSLFHYEAIQ